MREKVKDQRIRKIKEVLQTGPKTVKELEESTGIPRRSLYRYLNELKLKNVVGGSGRNGGYYLIDPIEARKTYKETINTVEVFNYLNPCGVFVYTVRNAPTKSSKRKLTVKVQKILHYTLQIAAIDILLHASTRREIEDMEKIMYYGIDAIEKLLWMSLTLLKSHGGIKLRKELKVMREEIMKEAFREVDSLVETVKRVMGHLKSRALLS